MKKENNKIFSFAGKLLSWFDHSGRKNLPWQTKRTPYRVWISEIMLQQTQVTTVISYYERFVEQFPNISSLANAHVDEVLHLWSGLGYYSRARNLHKTAQRICHQYGGDFPSNINDIMKLPGIGRSTAGAILALSREDRHPILDGNVKRVLCRFHAVDGWPGEAATERELWRLAEKYTPHERVSDYTQAIMDLGATLCKRSAPQCGRCPFAEDCQAHKAGKEDDYPQRRPAKKIPSRSSVFLLIREESGRILLEKRPPSGIWGGLWSLPQLSRADEIDKWCRKEGLQILKKEEMQTFRHTFSHFHLNINPFKITVRRVDLCIAKEEASLHWFMRDEIEKLGLPAPVKKLI